MPAADACDQLAQQGAPQGDSLVAFRPFYALHHAQTPEDAGHYYCVRRDESLLERSPGFETQVSNDDVPAAALGFDSDFERDAGRLVEQLARADREAAEVGRRLDRAIDMGFGRQVDHRVRVEICEHAIDRRA